MPEAIALLKKTWPYLVAAAIGAGSAWWVQGLRVVAAQQELVTYKQEQKDTVQNAKDKAEKDRLTQEKTYAAEKEKLVAQVAAGDAYRRCVQSGKCLPVKPACTADHRVSPTVATTDPGTDAVPPTPGAATENEITGSGDPVIGDCAVTTLMLNRLQEAIESQPGF